MKTSIRFIIVILLVVIVAIYTINNFSTINYINKPHGISPIAKDMKLTTKLYFVNNDKKLEYETRTLTVTDNDFVGAVVEALVAGPRNEHLYTVLDDNVKVLSASILDKKCTVDFALTMTMSSFFKYGFLDQMVWSVVNSLTELENIDKVRILINGQDIQAYSPDFTYFGNLTKNEQIIHVQPKPPADVVIVFLENITTERYDLAYELVTFESKQKYPFDDFVAKMQNYNKSNVGYQRNIYFTQNFRTSMVVVIKYISNDVDEYGQRVTKIENWELLDQEGVYRILLQ